MLINRVEIKPCVMPKKDKNWRFALTTTLTGETRGWIVSIILEKGPVGYGYGQGVPQMGAG